MWLSNDWRICPFSQVLLAQLPRISVDFCRLLAVRLFVHGQFAFNLRFNRNRNVYAQRRLDQGQYNGVWLWIRCTECRPGHIHTGFPLHAKRKGKTRKQFTATFWVKGISFHFGFNNRFDAHIESSFCNIRGCRSVFYAELE